MKLKRILLVGLLLAVFTIGAAGASDNMTVADSGCDLVGESMDDVLSGNEVDGETTADENREDYAYDANGLQTIGVKGTSEDVSDSINDASAIGEGIKEEINETDYEIYVPEEIFDQWDDWWNMVRVEMPSDAGGNISITVDGVGRYNQTAGYNEMSLCDLNLDYGNHSLVICYDGDSKYAGFLKEYSFEKIYLDVDCPDNFQLPNYDLNLVTLLSIGVNRKYHGHDR